MERLKKGAAGATIVGLILLTVFIFTKDGAAATDQSVETLVIQTAGKQEEQKNPLEKNRYPEINELVETYYRKVASGDLEGLEEITGGISENFRQEIAGNQKFVEDYQNIEVYTKCAEAEDAYIVFTYYEMKIRDIDTPVPGLGNLYVTKNQDGRYIVANGIYDSRAQEYVQQVAEDEDVQALVREVQQKYRRARESDETLRLALDDLRAAYSE